MPPVTFRPEELDIAILREMYRSGSVNLAGIDPRLNATRVAQSLHIGRARVAARLKWWRESGFLKKYAVWLNPALLGWHGAWTSIRVDRHHSKNEIFRRLGLVDGVVSAMDFLGEWISVALVTPNPAALERRLGVIRGFVGVAEVDAPAPWRVPEAKRPLTPLEIRVVQALRKQPTATLSEVARRVGISTRTMTRKYSDLVDHWAVWFVPVFDFTALNWTVVSMNVHVAPGVGREAVSRTLRTKFPAILDFTTVGIGPDVSPQDLVFFVVIPSAASLEQLEQFAASVDGVEKVESFIMIRIHDYPDWFDSHLETLAAEGHVSTVPSSDRTRSRRVS